ncbi:MAG: HlyC/CorC family transporter [Acidobacteria bacterium]|nr:HlyC/CorC family transporter [Acidobacteriota bacterium]
MKADVVNWLLHPVTLTLLGTAVFVVMLLAEILQRRLSEFGNVRFQGLVEDHEALLALGSQEHVVLSPVLTALRWIQMVCLFLVWTLLFFGINLGVFWAVGSALGVLMGVALLAQWPFGGLSESGVAKLLRLLRPLVAPIARFGGLGASENVEGAEEDEEEASDREIRAFLDVGEAAGIIEGEEGEILESLVEFFDTTVREVMTPRTDIVAVPEFASWEELMETFGRTHKSRVPVFRETVDDIVGVVHVKNLIKDFIEGGRPPVRDLFRPCPVVPESKELGELLKEFQQEHQQMAIVVDEYGGTSGLVTLEDIIEEIVGEIQDELDPAEPPEWEELRSGVFRLQGRAPLEVLEELFGLELDEEDVDTVGGLVFSRHGTVPEAGTVVEMNQGSLIFEVEKMDGRRIVSVIAQRPRSADDSGEK